MTYPPSRCPNCRGNGKAWAPFAAGITLCTVCKGAGFVVDRRVAVTLQTAKALGWNPVPGWPEYAKPGACKGCGESLSGRRRSWCGRPICRFRFNRRLYLNVHWTKRFIIVRDGSACRACGEVFEAPLYEGGPAYPMPSKLTVDHIVPLADGGTDSPENCQLLCADCHRTKTARENRARRTRCRSTSSPSPSAAIKTARSPATRSG